MVCRPAQAAIFMPVPTTAPGTNSTPVLSVTMTSFGNNGIGLPAPAPGAMHLDQTLTAAHFPLHQLVDQHVVGDPLNNPGNAVRDTNDVVSSQGVELMQFVDIVLGSPVDDGFSIADTIFNIDGTNIRRVEPRNTPTVINAVYNFENFHDGRANNIFNGNNPFGPADPRPHLLSNDTGTLATEELRLRQSSLASQAVGPTPKRFRDVLARSYLAQNRQKDAQFETAGSTGRSRK